MPRRLRIDQLAPPNFWRIAIQVLLLLIPAIVWAQYTVQVQVVDLQVSVSDANGQYIQDLKPDDFLVWEDHVAQDVLDLELNREPFSIGILLDTSSSMQSTFRETARSAQDFLASLRPQDEYFLMTFDDQVLMKKDFGLANNIQDLNLTRLHYGERTRLYDAIVMGLDRLAQAHYPRRALFVISDGQNTAGKADLKSAVTAAQKNKVLVYSLILNDDTSELNALQLLTEETGGTSFFLYSGIPRLQAAYEKIAGDLAHRYTLYYRSSSDYSNGHRPNIKVQMKNSHWRVRYQKTYYPDLTP